MSVRLFGAAVFATLAIGGSALAPTASADPALPVCRTLFGQDFSASTNPSLVGQVINFDGSCSKVPCPAFGSFSSCAPESYDWDFGNGTTASGPSSAGSAYFAPGTYNVSLTVSDYDGEYFTVTHQVTVLG